MSYIIIQNILVIFFYLSNNNVAQRLVGFIRNHRMKNLPCSANQDIFKGMIGVTRGPGGSVVQR